MALTPEQRTTRAKIAAFTRWSRETPTREHGQRAQAGLLARFMREVDPDNQLPEAERNRRALAARRAHMAGLALQSSKARSRKASGPAGPVAPPSRPLGGAA